MKVIDNVAIAMVHGRGKVGLKEAREKAPELLELLGLHRKADTLAKSLTLAERKKLEVARALATEPKIMLLDEFMAGLNPVEVDEALSMISKIREDFGITIFMIEHVLKAVMKICEKVMVLHHGVKIAEGSPKEIASNKDVIKAYLGDRYA